MIDLPEAKPATHVDAWAAEVLGQAQKEGGPARGSFNGEPMLAYPYDTVESVLSRYYRAAAASEMTPEQAREFLTRPPGRRITHFPFKTTHGYPVSAAKAGRIMDEGYSLWHVVQFFNFRFVIMWPGKR